jgi:hypothetical protein
VAVAAAPAPVAPQGMMDKLGEGLRGLVGRLGGAAKPKSKAKAGPDTLL